MMTRLILSVLCLIAAPVWAARIHNTAATIGPTPSIVGVSAGRAVVTIKNAAASSAAVFCGAANDADTQWHEISAGTMVTWGVQVNGQWSGATEIKCKAASSQTVYITDEGEIPAATSTPTNTPTNTPTATPTATP